MKTRYQVAIGSLVGLSLGAASITLYSERNTNSDPPEWLFISYTSQAIKDINALSQLHRGQTNDLVFDLEQDLSMQLDGLSRHFPTKALSDRKSARILNIAASYRAKHPFTTGDAETDRTVSALLARASERVSSNKNSFP